MDQVRGIRYEIGVHKFFYYAQGSRVELLT